jgi:hypothetical protein
VAIRALILMVVLVAIAGLGALTLKAAADGGFDILTVLSLLVLALFAFGIVGALLHPPEE